MTPAAHPGGGPTFVVGAGPSGLAAAWRLQRAGRPVVVLERGDRVGGQIRTHREDGFLMEQGSTVLATAYRDVFRLLAEADLLDELVPSGSVIGFVKDHVVHNLRSEALFRDGLSTRLVSRREKLALVRLGIDNLRLRRSMSYEDLSLAGAHDVETPADYCRRHRGLGGDVYEYLVDSTVRGVLATRGDRISVLEFFFMINNVLGSRLHAFREGWSTFPQRLARDLDVRLGAEVREVVPTAQGGVRVSWSDADGDHVEEGAAAVVSARADTIPDLVPTLAEADAAFLRSVVYSYVVAANYALSAPPPDQPALIIQVPRAEAPGLVGVTLEHNKTTNRVPPGKGLACLLSSTELAEELMDADDDAVNDALLPLAEQFLPGLTSSVERAWIRRWHPVIVYSRPGYYREAGAFLRRQDPRSPIQVAGSFASSSNINTAVASGERSARRLLGGA
ncbi:NAD(P)/FAD-dependent oxidoreductase [Patulibacter brassicae]|uniref:NAD(P)/FAD-dependent oxidoreductase n=1 Tax=Patulibacter brassicae TaxID=1705717 RepID=A0ABU4VRP7_9ACTN|nr:NAD(P)/FAD-dependent oxidoreductase [Patulibacter brassicae]MDX8153784.1 NAD(P)/FAD-dependent oxidoreductase [Patulibacter brassicae]